MADVNSTSTIALIAYPKIWAASLEVHPRTAPDYNWHNHLRDLCKRARALHKEQPIELKVAGEAERMFITALATVSTELLVLDIQRDRACRKHLPKFALWWADPDDTHLRRSLPEPVRADRPRSHMQR
jgi:hypothetical protein